MARFTISSFFGSLKKDVTHTKFLPMGTTARLAVANVFGKATDSKERGWLKFVSPDISGALAAGKKEKQAISSNPIGMRLLSIWNYPYLVVHGFRYLMMRGIDQGLVLRGRARDAELRSPGWAIALKALFTPLYIAEIPLYFVSKAMDKVTDKISSGIKSAFSSLKSKLKPSNKAEHTSSATIGTELTHFGKPIIGPAQGNSHPVTSAGKFSHHGPVKPVTAKANTSLNKPAAAALQTKTADEEDSDGEKVGTKRRTPKK